DCAARQAEESDSRVVGGLGAAGLQGVVPHVGRLARDRLRADVSGPRLGPARGPRQTLGARSRRHHLVTVARSHLITMDQEVVMLMEREAFQNTLRTTLESHITLDHPIFYELMKDEPNWLLLRMMTLQGYQLTKNFLTYIEHLFFYCPLPRHKRLLLHNL